MRVMSQLSSRRCMFGLVAVRQEREDGNGKQQIALEDITA